LHFNAINHLRTGRLSSKLAKNKIEAAIAATKNHKKRGNMNKTKLFTEPDLIGRLKGSLTNRLKLMVAVLFFRDRNLPSFSPIEKTKKIIGSADIFKLLENYIPWNKKCIVYDELIQNGDKNPQSCEKDVAILLYNLTRLIKANKVVEVGIYRGAGSLHLAQGIHDNGGGTIWLVDISEEYLIDVRNKIENNYSNVKVNTFCGDSIAASTQAEIPVVDLVFLDTEHSYTAAILEIKNYLLLVRHGGFIVIHDTIKWEASKAANEIFSKGVHLSTFATSFGRGISILKKDESASGAELMPAP